jgi:hypothetical protein
VPLPRDSSTRALRRPRPDPRARSAAGTWVLRHRALPRALSLNRDSEGGTPPAAEATRKPAPSPSDRVSRTRDGWTDSKRGHHDFQSWTEIALTGLKVLQFRRFTSSTSDETKSAISLARRDRLARNETLASGQAGLAASSPRHQPRGRARAPTARALGSSSPEARASGRKRQLLGPHALPGVLELRRPCGCRERDGGDAGARCARSRKCKSTRTLIRAATTHQIDVTAL